jgi:hypothetical protein
MGILDIFKNNIETESILNNEITENLTENIFLGFRFGMSPKEANEHIKRLIAQNRIYTIEDKYVYDFYTLLGEKLQTVILLEYYEDKLYQLNLIFPLGIMSLESMYNELKDIYDIKYDKEGFSIKKYQMIGKESTMYEKGDLQIRLTQVLHVQITYENTKTAMEIAQRELDEMAKLSDSTLSDI